jgi:hypothetical protein
VIARGSMVALKGHERVPMVVVKRHEMVRIDVAWSGDALRLARHDLFKRMALAKAAPPPADGDAAPEDAEDHVEVVWLDAEDKPQKQVYPISLLVELDDA